MSDLIKNRGIYSGALADQLNQLQSLYPNLKDLKYECLNQSPNPNLFEFNKDHNLNTSTNFLNVQQSKA